MVALVEMASLPLLWTVLGGVAAGAATMQPGPSLEARRCLARVAPLPKAEGYGALCTSIQSLYTEQQNAATSFLEMKEDHERSLVSNAELQRRNQELEAQLDEMQTQKASREQKWQAAAKEFQAGVASRDAQWQATVSSIEAAADKKFQAAVAKRDAHWQATIRRLESDKNEAEQQALESEKQKEAMEASTSVGTDSRRSMFLALNREEKKEKADAREVEQLLAQIKALQKENAQLVQRCVVGN